MSCLLTGTESFPGNIQGGSDNPAGWAKGISIDQELKNFLQSRDETRTRFGSLEFGVAVPNRADPWTRTCYAGPNQPVAPVDDPRQMLRKLYGQMKDRESVSSVLDDVREELGRVSKKLDASDRVLLDQAPLAGPGHGAAVGYGGQGETAKDPRAGHRSRHRTGQRQHAADQSDADRSLGERPRQRHGAGRHLAIHALRRSGAHVLVGH